MGKKYKKNERELEINLLIEQRNKLIDGICMTNETFHKTIVAVISALVSLIATNIFVEDKTDVKTISLLIIQLMVMLIMYITIQLINGNLQRYYVCAIDDYLYKNYKITCLFYHGYTGVKHVAGKNSTLPFMTTSISVIITCALVWIVYELKIYSYIFNNKGFTLLLIVEIVFFLIVVAINMRNKIRCPKEFPKEYEDVMRYLER